MSQPPMTVSEGLLQGVRYVASPNCDARPPGTGIDLLVIHNISLPPGDFGGAWIEDLFLNRLDRGAHPYFATLADLKVSAHLLLRRDGEIIQFVPFTRRAWHAGVSSFQGRERCNDFSIGVEVEGADETPFEPIQYARLARIAVALMDAYPGITPARMTGHSDIAPGRKTDPGPAFDWARLRALIDQYTT